MMTEKKTHQGFDTEYNLNGWLGPSKPDKELGKEKAP